MLQRLNRISFGKNLNNKAQNMLYSIKTIDFSIQRNAIDGFSIKNTNNIWSKKNVQFFVIQANQWCKSSDNLCRFHLYLDRHHHRLMIRYFLCWTFRSTLLERMGNPLGKIHCFIGRCFLVLVFILPFFSIRIDI